MSTKSSASSLFDSGVLGPAALDAFRKLDPRSLARNPVIFVTEVVAALVTFLWIRDLAHAGAAMFSGQIAAWLWFTALFATFAEAVAEGRGKAQAATLRRTRGDTSAKRLLEPAGLGDLYEGVNALELKPGDVVLVEAGDIVPSDGEIIEGVAA